MSEQTLTETARHYHSGQQRLRAFVLELSDADLGTSVQATPPWTVHDVVAHLAALTTDVLTGRLEGFPDDDFTAGQVAARRERSAEELIAEWDTNLPRMLELGDALSPALAVDVLTHEQDIRGALGLLPVLSADELRFGVSRFCFGLGRAYAKTGAAPFAVEATDSDFRTVVGEGDPRATVAAPEFELFRALAGRRSRGQVAGFDWTGDPAPYLERFNVFGALPEADLVEKTG
jgi:uncharacterized protein (TIGR03083 family)